MAEKLTLASMCAGGVQERIDRALAKISDNILGLNTDAKKKRVLDVKITLTPKEEMKAGKKVARQGWNGKGQYIELASNISYVNADGNIVNCEHDAIGNKAIAFVGTSGVQMGWLASQADMLAEDWQIVQ